MAAETPRTPFARSRAAIGARLGKGVIGLAGWFLLPFAGSLIYHGIAFLLGLPERWALDFLGAAAGLGTCTLAATCPGWALLDVLLGRTLTVGTRERGWAGVAVLLGPSLVFLLVFGLAALVDSLAKYMV